MALSLQQELQGTTRNQPGQHHRHEGEGARSNGSLAAGTRTARDGGTSSSPRTAMHPSSSSSSSSASASASTSSPAPAHPPPSNTDSGFEFYDPRGLFSRRRSSSGATSTSQANRNAAKQALQRQWEQQQRRGGKVEEEEDREGVGQGEGKQHGGSIVEEEDSDRRDSSMMSWLSLSSSSIPERSEDENPTSASPACSSCHSDHVNKAQPLPIAAGRPIQQSPSSPGSTSTSTTATSSLPIAIPTHQSPDFSKSRLQLSRLHMDGQPPRYSTAGTSTASHGGHPRDDDDDDTFGRLGLRRPPSFSSSNTGTHNNNTSLNHSHSTSGGMDHTPPPTEPSSLSGSSVISPAAEFLGSFSSSTMSNPAATSTRDRSFTAASQAMQAGGARPLQSPTEGLPISSSSIMSFIAPDPDEEGQEVNGYLLEGAIGHGTFSTVRRARNLETGQVVACKIVRHDSFRTDGGGVSVLTDDEEVARSESPKPLSRDPSTATAGKPDQKPDQQKTSRKARSPRPSKPTRMRSCSSPMIHLPSAATLAEWSAQHYQNPDGLETIEGLPTPSSMSDLDMEFDPTPQNGSNQTTSVMNTDASASSSSDEEDEEDDEDAPDTYQSLADPALQKEIKIWCHLAPHPHIVPLIDYYEDDFASYIFMPLCQGGNLLEYLKAYCRDHAGQGGGTRRDSDASASGGLSRAGSISSNHAGGGASSTASSSARSPAPGSLSSSINEHSGSCYFPRDDQKGTTTTTTTTTTAAINKPHRSTSIRMRHPGEIQEASVGLPLPSVKKVFGEIVAGLLYLHQEAKVTHKDIKLENILLDLDESSLQPREADATSSSTSPPSKQQTEATGHFKISDFGLAHTNEALSSASPWRKRLRGNARLRRQHALSDGAAVGATSPSGQLPPSSNNAGPSAQSSNYASLTSAASQMLPEPLSASVPSAVFTAGDSASPGPPVLKSPAAAGAAIERKRPVVSLHRTVSLHNASNVARRRAPAPQAIPANLSTLSISSFESTMGSLQYTSPEQIRSPSTITDQSVDIWALGCVLFALLEGKLPFDDGFEPRLRVSIMKGQWKTPKALKRTVDKPPTSSTTSSSSFSTGLHSMQEDSFREEDEEKAAIETVLAGCLEVDPAKRWTIQQVAESEWLKGYVPTPQTPSSPIPSNPRSRGRKRESAGSGTTVTTAKDGSSRRGRGAPLPDHHLLDPAVQRLSRGAGGKERSESRGRRPGLLGSRDPSASSSKGGRSASGRRGPTQDEYRRARGESQDRSPTGSTGSGRNRSSSRPRRYGGDSTNSWEVL